MFKPSHRPAKNCHATCSSHVHVMVMACSPQKEEEKMQFILECGGRCGPRIGKLMAAPNGLPNLPSFATPLCVLYSRGGAVPNLTRDLEEEVLQGVNHVTGSKEAVMLTMPTMYMKLVIPCEIFLNSAYHVN